MTALVSKSERRPDSSSSASCLSKGARSENLRPGLVHLLPPFPCAIGGDALRLTTVASVGRASEAGSGGGVGRASGRMRLGPESAKCCKLKVLWVVGPCYDKLTA